MNSPNVSPAEHPFNRAIEKLCGEDPEMTAHAAEIFICLASDPRFAHQVVPMLVREACLRHKRPDDCVRILGVVQRIGRPLDSDSFMDLMFLANISAERVAAKVSRVIAVAKDSQPTPQSAV